MRRCVYVCEHVLPRSGACVCAGGGPGLCISLPWLHFVMGPHPFGGEAAPNSPEGLAEA